MNNDIQTALEKIFAADSAIYAGRGFQRRIGYGERPALINIDLANAWTRPGNPFTCEGMDTIIPAVRKLLAGARARGVPVVYTTTAYNVTEGPNADTGLWHLKIPVEVLEVGSPAVAIDERVAPLADEQVIVKKRASAFHGTYLAGFLRAANVDTVILTGVTCSACVRNSCEDAIAEGFRPIVVREAVGDRVPGAVEWNLFDMDAKFGDVEPLEAVLAYLDGLPAEAAESVARVGVDVGGTNTDLVLESERGVHVHKVPSTPADQSVGVLRGLTELCEMAGVRPGEVDLIVHGTTVATNITIEHSGAEVGMLTTRNFRDILHIGRHKRPHNFSLHFDVPWQSRPLVKRRNRIPITERILPPDGRVETPLAEDEVLAAIDIFRRRGIESVVIGFLFSFANDAHERQAKAIVEREMPGAYVCCSSEVANVIREFERFSTAAMNAFVGPQTTRYLRNLERKLADSGFRANLRLIQSNGGVSTVEGCAKRAVSILMSGPAGGVIGGRSEGMLCGAENLITVDIGGTSADISTIPEGRIKIMNPRDSYVSGHPIMVPMIDLVTIGAGGGSIAHVDSAGGFHVGPRSAGADPGPACYGKGGEEPTVTDAQVVLGRLDADKLLGGDLPVDASLAERAIEEKIARPLDLSVKDAALGILRVINSNMALAIRSNSVARGVDPREFSLVPFGGAGPLHGVALAEAVSAKDIIVPVAPGITAAMGLLETDMQYEHARSLIRSLTHADADAVTRLNALVSALLAECRRDLEADGVPPGRQRYQRFAECRYHGQGFELRAEIPEGEVTLGNVSAIAESFHAQHRRDYGYAFEDGEVELITVRAIGTEEVAPLEVARVEKANGAGIEGALLYSRPTTFDDGETLDTPRYDRRSLRAGHRVHGAAVVVQHDSTVLVPPGYVADVADHGNLLIRRSA